MDSLQNFVISTVLNCTQHVLYPHWSMILFQTSIDCKSFHLSTRPLFYFGLCLSWWCDLLRKHRPLSILTVVIKFLLKAFVTSIFLFFDSTHSSKLRGNVSDLEVNTCPQWSYRVRKQMGLFMRHSWGLSRHVMSALLWNEEYRLSEFGIDLAHATKIKPQNFHFVHV